LPKEFLSRLVLSCQFKEQIKKVVKYECLAKGSASTLWSLWRKLARLVVKTSELTQEVKSFKEEVISINIPGGVAEGIQLSMSGKRNDFQRKSQRNLLIVIEEGRGPLRFKDW